jgi:hypothetical protein
MGAGNGVFEPDWEDLSGDWSAQGTLQVNIRPFRAAWFLLTSFWNVLVFLFLLWRGVRKAKKDPEATHLDGWRRWVWQTGAAAMLALPLLSSCTLFENQNDGPMGWKDGYLPSFSVLGAYASAQVDTLVKDSLMGDTLFVALDSVAIISPCFLDSIVPKDSLALDSKLPPKDSVTPLDTNRYNILFFKFWIHLTSRGSSDCPAVPVMDTVLVLPWQKAWNEVDTLLFL